MTWPIENIVRIIRASGKYKIKNNNSASGMSNSNSKWVSEILMRHFRLLTYLIVSVLAYFFTNPFIYAKELRFGWIMMVVARNLVIGLGLSGLWHWFIYDSKWGCRHNPVVFDIKFNPNDQYSVQQPPPPLLTQNAIENAASFPLWFRSSLLRQEIFNTTIGLLISSLYEVVVNYLWANDLILQPCYTNFFQFPIYSLFHVLLIPYWRDGHFFFAHRVMHPWNKYILGFDPGRFLYKVAHQTHHRSHNPGPFSGLSMHPLEHLIYYSCTIIPALFFSIHPFHFLFNKFHADLSPLAGHDGHGAPAGGSWFHYLHHAHFECNYGTPLVPLDKLFGTYEDGCRWSNKHNN